MQKDSIIIKGQYDKHSNFISRGGDARSANRSTNAKPEGRADRAFRPFGHLGSLVLPLSSKQRKKISFLVFTSIKC